MTHHHLKNAYVKDKAIGRGGFGTVYLAYPKTSGDRSIDSCLAMKQIPKTCGGNVEREMNIIQSLNHVNIVRYIGAYSDVSDYIILMELCNQNLESFLIGAEQSGEFIPAYFKIEWAKQIGLGVQYLHDHHIIHRDLKPPNILINSRDSRIHDPSAVTMKVSDFGLSRYMETDESVSDLTRVGTRYYLAPELLVRNDSRLNPKAADVFSLGCLFFFLLQNCKLMEGIDASQPDLDHLLDAKLRRTIGKQGAWRRLVSQMVLKDRNLRPNIKEVLEADVFIRLAPVVISDYDNIQKIVNSPNFGSISELKKRHGCPRKVWDLSLSTPLIEEEDVKQLLGWQAIQRDTLQHIYHFTLPLPTRKICLEKLRKPLRSIQQPISYDLAKQLTLDLIDGVQQLHDQDMFHGHLNLDNVFVCGSNGQTRLKLGFSTETIFVQTTQSTDYLLCKSQTFFQTRGQLSEAEKKKEDIFATSCLIHFICSGSFPFSLSDLTASSMSLPIKVKEDSISLLWDMVIMPLSRQGMNLAEAATVIGKLKTWTLPVVQAPFGQTEMVYSVHYLPQFQSWLMSYKDGNLLLISSEGSIPIWNPHESSITCIRHHGIHVVMCCDERASLWKIDQQSNEDIDLIMIRSLNLDHVQAVDIGTSFWCISCKNSFIRIIPLEPHLLMTTVALEQGKTVTRTLLLDNQQPDQLQFFIGYDDGTLAVYSRHEYEFRPSTSQVGSSWRSPITSLCATNDTVFISTWRDGVFAYDLGTANIRQVIEACGQMISQIAIWQHYLVTMTKEGVFKGFDVTDLKDGSKTLDDGQEYRVTMPDSDNFFIGDKFAIAGPNNILYARALDFMSSFEPVVIGLNGE